MKSPRGNKGAKERRGGPNNRLYSEVDEWRGDLVAVGSDGGGRLLVNVGLLLCIRQFPGGQLLPLVVGRALGLSPLLEPVCRVSTTTSPPSAWQGRQEVANGNSTYVATTSWYFQPTSWLSRPTVQYLRPGCRRRTRRAWGTTIRLTLSYGGGTPSNTFNRSKAAAPRDVLCGIMPRTAL